MKKTKNFFPRLLTVLLLCCLLLCACQNGIGGTPTPSTSTGSATSPANDPENPDQEDALYLVKDGVSDFCIVQARSTSETIVNAAQSIQSRVKLLTGVEIPIVNAKEVGETQSCLIIGNNQSFEEPAEVLKQWAPGTYGYAYRNRRLMLLGNNDMLVEKAVTQFLSDLYGGTVKGEAHTDLKINLSPECSRFLYDEWLSDVPMPEKTYSGLYDCGNRTYMLTYQNFSQAQMDSYLQALDGSEFSQAQTHRIGNNLYATYLSGNQQITYAYNTSSRLLRLTFQNSDSGIAFPNFAPESDYEKLGETQLGVLSLNYPNAIPDQTDAGGLSMVITLEDGRFLIIDGGYTEDATGLYNYLYDHNRRSDGIVIAAWILTHGHGDHVNCFAKFASQYGSKVTCQYFVSNALSPSVIPTNEGNSNILNQLQNYCERFGGDTKIIKPHSGQVLHFCNVKIEMLLTHEDLYPRTVNWLNETSLVFRVTANGQSLLVTGDSELQPIPLLNSLYGEELKSDLFQINHHGYSQIDALFFRNVDPDVAIWPSSQASVDIRKLASWRNGIYADLIASTDAYYVADGTVEILTFPYHFGDTYEEYTMDFTERKK